MRENVSSRAPLWQKGADRGRAAQRVEERRGQRASAPIARTSATIHMQLAQEVWVSRAGGKACRIYCVSIASSWVRGALPEQNSQAIGQGRAHTFRSCFQHAVGVDLCAVVARRMQVGLCAGKGEAFFEWARGGGRRSDKAFGVRSLTVRYRCAKRSGRRHRQMVSDAAEIIVNTIGCGGIFEKAAQFQNDEKAFVL